MGLSQDQFADAFRVSASTLRKWEQGQRSPTGAAKTLLKIIEREPKAVVRALKIPEGAVRAVQANDEDDRIVCKDFAYPALHEPLVHAALIP